MSDIVVGETETGYTVTYTQNGLRVVDKYRTKLAALIQAAAIEMRRNEKKVS